jgi:hypothetical protein
MRIRPFFSFSLGAFAFSALVFSSRSGTPFFGFALAGAKAR